MEDIVEVDGVVYLKCACGGLTRTSLKPMTASIPCEDAVELGYVSSLEGCNQIHRRYAMAKK